MLDINVYFIDTNKYSLDEIMNNKYINKKDIDNAFRFKMELNRKEELISSYFKNKYINDEIYFNEHNKPLTNNKYFNISHSNGLVIFSYLDDIEIGIDIEKIREAKEDLIKYISSPLECKYIDSNRKFYEIWTSKEAIVKCHGNGLTGIVKEIPGLPLIGTKEYQGKLYRCNMISNDIYAISVVINSDIDFNINFINEVLNSN